jgi:hypothetical protein
MELMGEYRHRILRPTLSLSASKLLLHRQIPPGIPTPVSNSCRMLARQILEVLEVAPPSEEEEESDTSDAVAAIDANESAAD